MPTLCQRKKGSGLGNLSPLGELATDSRYKCWVQCISMGVNGLYYTLMFGWMQYRYGEIIVDLRINETLQTGAVENRTYQVRGESVYLFFEFTIRPSRVGI